MRMLIYWSKIIVIVVGCIALFVGLTASFLKGLIDLSGVVGAGATMIAAFIGAYLAFDLNHKREVAKTKRENIVAINRSLFVLARQSNAIDNYKRLMADYKSDPERAFSMPAFKPPNYAILTHDFDRLAFIIDSADPQELMELSLEQERFEQTVEAIRIRNEFYVNEIQPTMIAQGLTGSMLHTDDIRRVLGERLFGGAMDGAKSVYEHVTSSSKSLPEMLNRLRQIAKELFPGKKFLSIETKHNDVVSPSAVDSVTGT